MGSNPGFFRTTGKSGTSPALLPAPFLERLPLGSLFYIYLFRMGLTQHHIAQNNDLISHLLISWINMIAVVALE